MSVFVCVCVCRWGPMIYLVSEDLKGSNTGTACDCSVQILKSNPFLIFCFFFFLQYYHY